MAHFRQKLTSLRNSPAFQADPAGTLLRLAAWRWRCAVGAGAVVQLSDGSRLELPAEWRGVAKLLYAFRSHYERELPFLIGRLRPGMVFADVGASYGVYTVLGARAVGPEGTVLSFEPGRRAFEVLMRNVRLNQLTNVRAFRAALGESGRKGHLIHHADPSRNALCAGRRPASESEEVEVLTLDGLLEQQAVTRVDVMKVDVEGAEALVFSGAKRLIERCRPEILFEINGPACDALGLDRRQAWDLLEQMGYRFCSVGPDGGLQHLDAPRDGNVLALARSDP